MILNRIPAARILGSRCMGNALESIPVQSHKFPHQIALLADG
jgi:hypothetical protein